MMCMGYDDVENVDSILKIIFKPQLYTKAY